MKKYGFGTVNSICMDTSDNLPIQFQYQKEEQKNVIWKSFYWGRIKLGPRNYIKSTLDISACMSKRNLREMTADFEGFIFFPKVVC